MALLLADSIPFTVNTQIDRRYPLGGDSGVGRPGLFTSGGLFNGPYYRLFSGYWQNGGWTGGSYLKAVIGGLEKTIIAQFAFNMESTQPAQGQYVVRFLSPSGVHIYVRWFSGQIRVYRGDNSTLLAQSTQNYSLDTWYLCQVKVYLHASAGTVTVKIGNETPIAITGAATKYSTDDYINEVQFGGLYQNNNYQKVSDIIVMDGTGSYCNDMLGMRLVRRVVPTGNGNYSEWTRNTGANNYENIDEIPSDGDTTYNYTATVNAKDSFVCEDLSEYPEISAAMLTMDTKLLDVGLAKVAGFVRSNNVDGVGPDVYPQPGVYNMLGSPIYVDPNTNAPFTRTAFNAAEFGYKKTV